MATARPSRHRTEIEGERGTKGKVAAHRKSPTSRDHCTVDRGHLYPPTAEPTSCPSLLVKWAVGSSFSLNPTTMSAPKDPVWSYVSPGSRDKRVVFNFCTKELYANPADLELHIVSGTCNPPEDVRHAMMLRLRDNQRKTKMGSVSLRAELDGQVAAVARAADGASAPERTKRGEAAAVDVGTGRGKMTPLVRRLGHKESAELDARCAMWVYRSALSIRTTEDLHFRSFCKALNPAYTPPSRFSISGELLDNAHEDMKKVVDARVDRALASGDAIVGGDLWTDRSMTSICNFVIFPPDPLYVETGVWGEERHSAVNNAAFFKQRIDALGSSNVSAFVFDTEPKMRAVWEILERDYPTMSRLPCAAHCLDLMLTDVCKYEDLRSALEFCNDMKQYWRHRGLPKTILERCQLGEYGKASAGASWSDSVEVAGVCRGVAAQDSRRLGDGCGRRLLQDAVPARRVGCAEEGRRGGSSRRAG